MGKIIGVLTVIIIVAAGGYYWMLQRNAETIAPVVEAHPAPSTIPVAITPASSTAPSGAQVTIPKTVTVSYDGKAFTPASVTLAKGDTVTFTDIAGATMSVASGQHPTHISYDGISRKEHCAAGYTGPKPFDQCTPGSSFSFTFDKIGAWSYHDHGNASAQGVVNVVVQ